MIHLDDFHENHNHSMALRTQNTEFQQTRSRKVEKCLKIGLGL